MISGHSGFPLSRDQANHNDSDGNYFGLFIIIIHTPRDSWDGISM